MINNKILKQNRCILIMNLNKKKTNKKKVKRNNFLKSSSIQRFLTNKNKLKGKQKNRVQEKESLLLENDRFKIIIIAIFI